MRNLVLCIAKFIFISTYFIFIFTIFPFGILNFCNKLNLNGFSDLKLNISVDYQVQKLNQEKKEVNISTGSPLKKEIIELEELFNHLINNIDQNKIIRFAQKIKKAKNIYLLDFNDYDIAARLLHLKLTELGFKSYVLDEPTSVSFSNRISQNDLVMLFSSYTYHDYKTL